jgi:hypothetical protein
MTHRKKPIEVALPPASQDTEIIRTLRERMDIEARLSE